MFSRMMNTTDERVEGDPMPMVARIMEMIANHELTEEEIEDIIFEYTHGGWML